MYYVKKTLREKNVQDRVERSKLEVELKLIEKHKRSELRMHESEAQKIRTKYSKLGIFSASFSEAAGVKMYETHNPGFCYKRNGAHKIPPSFSTTPVLDFQQLRSLVFTNDDLDMEKLLCLHMLSIHKTESLAMPNVKIAKDIPKENTPMERLIQRSKKMSKEKKDHEILNILPIYVIDIGQNQSCTTIGSVSREENEEQLFRDARMTSKLVINVKVQEILASALTALKASNGNKWKQLVENCQNVTYLKKIFNKPAMQEFLKMLKTYSLITSCESYFLTPKIKQQPVAVDVRTVFGNLESLLHQIRRHILQVPSKTKNEWRSLCELDEDILHDCLISSTSQQLATYDIVNKFAHFKKSSKSVVSSALPRKSELLESSSYLGGRSYRNFINRNIFCNQGESITRKIFADVEDRTNKSSSTSVFRKKAPSLRHYQLPSIASGQETEIRITEGSLGVTATNLEEDTEKFVKNTFPETSSFIKRTSCCACQEKWRLSLPTPKIPNYPRPGLPLQIYEDPYKISHMNRISSMISEELHRLDSYETRYSLDNVNVRIKSDRNSTTSATPENEISTIADSVEISPYDLARVSHEIADKETDKKLNAFLKETI